MGLGVLLLSMFSVFFLFTSDMAQHDANQVMQQTVSENLERARLTVQYMNAITEYRYKNPEDNHETIDEDKLSYKPSASLKLKHVIDNKKVFVFQTERPGLMGALNSVTHNSVLLGRVKRRAQDCRLVDGTNVIMVDTLPKRLTENCCKNSNKCLVYLN